MQGMTDEQYKEVFIAAISAFNDVLGASKSVEKARTASGRAAVEKAAPYLLAKPDSGECLAADRNCTVGQRIIANGVLANRLALYTAKPDDPRREAVIAELSGYLVCAAPSLSIEDLADRIIAAEDAVGKK